MSAAGKGKPLRRGGGVKRGDVRREVATNQLRTEIMDLYLAGFSQHAIAERFGLNQSNVSRHVQAVEAEWQTRRDDAVDQIKRRLDACLGLAFREAWRGWERSLLDAETTTAEEGHPPSPLGYNALHDRVAQLRGTPQECEACGSKDPKRTYDWANLTGRYEDPADYKRMCRRCHRKFDNGRAKAGATGLKKAVNEASRAVPVGLVPLKVVKKTQGQAGDPRFLDVMVKVTVDRAKLWGANAPEKRELTGKDGGPVLVGKSALEGIDLSDEQLQKLLALAEGRADGNDPGSHPEPR